MAVQDKLNSRPRICIDSKTPDDIFRSHLTIALAG